MKNTLIILIISVSLTSCASFQNSYVRKDKLELSETNFSKISGKYEMFSSFKYDRKGELIPNDDSILSQVNIYNQVQIKNLNLTKAQLIQ